MVARWHHRFGHAFNMRIKEELMEHSAIYQSINKTSSD
jgi:hypothetical protein